MTSIELAVITVVLFGLIAATVVDLSIQIRNLSRRVDELDREVTRFRSRQSIDRMTRDRGPR